MAKERKKENKPGQSSNVVMKNVIDFFKSIGLFFDVATLMIRMMINVLVYDNPHGKHEMQYEGSTAEKE